MLLHPLKVPPCSRPHSRQKIVPEQFPSSSKNPGSIQHRQSPTIFLERWLRANQPRSRAGQTAPTRSAQTFRCERRLFRTPCLFPERERQIVHPPGFLTLSRDRNLPHTGGGPHLCPTYQITNALSCLLYSFLADRIRPETLCRSHSKVTMHDPLACSLVAPTERATVAGVQTPSAPPCANAVPNEVVLRQPRAPQAPAQASQYTLSAQMPNRLHAKSNAGPALVSPGLQPRSQGQEAHCESKTSCQRICSDPFDPADQAISYTHPRRGTVKGAVPLGPDIFLRLFEPVPVNFQKRN